MKEADLIRKIQTWLKTIPGTWAYKVHGGMFGRAGVPDILICYRGRFYAMEAKVDHNTTTDKQAYELNLLTQAGAVAGVVRSLEDARRLMGLA